MNIINKVYAADPWSGLHDAVSSDLSSWEGLLRKAYELLNAAVPFAAIVAVVMIIVGGFSLMTAAGDPDKIQKGTKIVTASIIGLVLVFLSKLIVGLIKIGRAHV